jgi:hypothetical protein
MTSRNVWILGCHCRSCVQSFEEWDMQYRFLTTPDVLYATTPTTNRWAAVFGRMRLLFSFTVLRSMWFQRIVNFPSCDLFYCLRYRSFVPDGSISNPIRLDFATGERQFDGLGVYPTILLVEILICVFPWKWCRWKGTCFKSVLFEVHSIQPAYPPQHIVIYLK